MARYIVNILRNDVSHCAGAILDDDIIISASFCVADQRGVRYTILYNSRLRNNGTPHFITRKSEEAPLGFGNLLNDFFLFIRIIIIIKTVISIIVRLI